MTSETRVRCSTTGGRLVAIVLTLTASFANPQSKPEASLQDQLEQSCISTHVVESMDTEVREAISRVCRENSVIETQLTERLARCKHECELGRSALEWAKRQGFEECIVGWTRTTRYKDVLVVVKPGISDRRMWTRDVPFGLSPFTLPKGRHLCKWGFIGGPSSVIDSSGSEFSFFLADWVEG